jgi:hypothetical protein
MSCVSSTALPSKAQCSICFGVVLCMIFAAVWAASNKLSDNQTIGWLPCGYSKNIKKSNVSSFIM